MREILFRGKRLDNGEWVTGDMLADGIIRDHSTGYLIETKNMSIKGKFSCDAFRIDPSTLCQFTGLLDKDGNRIWEGDRLRIIYRRDVSGTNYLFDGIYTVKVGYRGVSFCFTHLPWEDGSKNQEPTVRNLKGEDICNRWSGKSENCTIAYTFNGTFTLSGDVQVIGSIHDKIEPLDTAPTSN